MKHRPDAAVVHPPHRRFRPQRLAQTCAALLVTLAAAMAIPPFVRAAEVSMGNIRFPANAHVFDVRTFGARGDGAADDTVAIQKAIDAAGGLYRRGTVYFPDGTYRISRTLTFSQGAGWKSAPAGITLQGQSRANVCLRLDDAAPGFTNPAQPKSLIDTATLKNSAGIIARMGYSNESFILNLLNLTLDVGKNNPGAVGLQYLANNVGVVGYVTVRSSDAAKRGAIGIDLGHTTAGGCGPALLKWVTVEGFDIGIRYKHPEISMTGEHLRLRDQRVVGIRNSANVLMLRDVNSHNTVPAIQNYNGDFGYRGTPGQGQVVIVDGHFTGGAAHVSAVDNQTGYLFARNLSADGYQSVIRNAGVVVPGATVGEYSSHGSQALFPSSRRTLNLPIEETPDPAHDDPSTWADVTKFGARPDYYYNDDTSGIQAAIDSGASTIYLPRGRYRIKNTIFVRGNVKRIVGMWASIELYGSGYAIPMFKVVDGTAPTVVIQDVFVPWMNTPSDTLPARYWVVEQATARTVVMKNFWIGTGKAYKSTGAPGKLFVENIFNCYQKGKPTDPTPVWQFAPGQKVWARQINPEHRATKIMNHGARLWILGLKTEQASIAVETRNGGETEVLGAFIFPVSGVLLPEVPAFVIDNGRASITASAWQAMSKHGVHHTVLKETQNGIARILTQQALPARGASFVLPLYTSYQAGGVPPTPTPNPTPVPTPLPTPTPVPTPTPKPSPTPTPTPVPNKLPTVSLTSPGRDATFPAPATITLTATASDPDGTIAKVEFFQGVTKIGEDTTVPYSVTWSNVAAGRYTLSARATDNDAMSATSAAVPVTVGAAPPASTPVNLALNKTATQSSTLPNTAASGNGALLAIDNNTNGDWKQGSVTHTSYQAQPWWQLDLGVSRAITTIELFNRTDSARERLSNFRVFVSDQPFPAGDLQTLLAQPGVWCFTGGAQAGNPTAVSVHRMGRYVRIQLAGTGYLSLAEVKVLGYPSTLPNLALGKSATQSSRPQGTPAPNAALDGNTNGLWTGGSVTHTGLDKQPWWQLDLGQSQTITTLNLFNRTDNSQARFSNVHVFVSDQPFASTDLTTTLKQPGVWHSHVAGMVGAPTSVPVHRAGRFVRIQLADTNYLSLAEVEVLGFPTPVLDVNLALGKSATQSSRPQGTPAPSAAVDGNTSGLWAGGSVTHTHLEPQPWWQVDLGASHSVTHLELFNRTDNATERLSDLIVFVSDTPFASTNLQATRAQPGVVAVSLPVQAGAPTSIPLHRSGRYVRVQLAGTNYLSLAEVKVWGLPVSSPAGAAAITTPVAGQQTIPTGESVLWGDSTVIRTPQNIRPGKAGSAARNTDNAPATTTTAPLIPASTRRPIQGTGLMGAYFDNRDGTGLVAVRLDATIDFAWGRGVPPGIALTSPDTFGVRWTGLIEAPVSGTYTFTTTSDDGIRLRVNNKLLVNDGTTHGVTDHENTIRLTAGQRYPIVIDYFEDCKSATAKLSWAYPGQAKQIVPTQRLYPRP